MGSVSHRTVAAVSALIAGILALVINAWLGWILWQGFTFDWFVHEPQATFEGAFVLTDVFLTALVTAVVTVLITVKATRHRFEQGDVRYDGPPDESEPRDTVAYTLYALLKYGSFSAIFLSIAVAVLFVGVGTEIAGSDFFVIKVAVGVIAGVYTGGGVAAGMIAGLASGTIVHDPSQGGAIARISLTSARRPVVVVALVLVLTAALGSGLFEITTEVDVADVLPRGNHNTDAAKNLTSDFKSAFTQQTNVLFSVDPERCREVSRTALPNRQTEVQCDDIRDEVYVRAMDEFYDYLSDETDIEYTISVPEFYKLINWTEAGGQRAPDSAFSLPPPDPQGEAQYRAVHEGVWAAIPDAVSPIISNDHKDATSLFMVRADSNVTQRELGRQFIEARDDYLDWVEQQGDYPVFTEDNKPLIFVDRPVANAHSSELAEQDFALLFPLILGFIAAMLWLAFRNPNAILVSGTTLLVGAVWTYGLMGHLEIPLNTLNLAVVPILLGNGIDYSIHMVNEFAEHKSELKGDEESLRLAGGRAGFAMFIATATTIAGLLVIMASPSLLMAQMAVLAAFAMAAIFLLTIAFIPAQLSLLKGTEGIGAKFTKSEVMPKMAAFVSRHKVAFGLLVVLLTAALVINAQNVHIEPFGDPARNWPEHDELRQEHEEGLTRFYDSPEGPEFKANVIVFEGDLYDYDAHRYMEELSFALAEQPDVDMSTSRNIPFLINTWNTVKDGAAGAPINLLLQEGSGEYYTDNPNYPRTRSEIKGVFDDVQDSPLQTFGSLFTNHPKADMGIMTFSVKSRSYADAERSWDQVWAAVDQVESERPDSIRVAFVGNTATNVLFVQGQLPWLNYMTVAALIVVTLLVAGFTKDLRATAAVAALVGLSTVWVFGLLPTIGVGLAVTLLLPLVFITSIGSDYVVHLIWNIKKTGSAWHTFGTTGKAVMFSAITDAGAFVIFSRTQNLAVRDAVVTTALAIGVIFVATLLVVSLFYKVEEDEVRDRPTAGEAERTGEEVPAAAEVPVETRLAEGGGTFELEELK